eukprot:GHVU01025906.1.p1 GENE.GHVU01025906.1~~GHVU01025906.1.p1  ORF type:complete len:190 (+),score=7.37 GHVU01025906.1:153-722(+)
MRTNAAPLSLLFSMLSHDAATRTVSVAYLGADRSSKRHEYSHADRQFIFFNSSEIGDQRPRSPDTSKTVREALQYLVNSALELKFNWSDYTIAFKITNESGENVWRTDGTDDVQLREYLEAFIFKNTGPKFAACRNIECLINTYLISLPTFVVAPCFMSVGETGSLQDRSSLCMPLCRTSFSSPRTQRA